MISEVNSEAWLKKVMLLKYIVYPFFFFLFLFFFFLVGYFFDFEYYSLLKILVFSFGFFCFLSFEFLFSGIFCHVSLLIGMYMRKSRVAVK